jgi:uncharacterized protein (TIGR02466 family)
VSRQPDADGFLQLWPTLMLQRALPGHEAANPLLQQLIEAEEAGNADLTTAYRAGNLLAFEHPVVAWLRECINKTVVDYLGRCGLGYPVEWTLHGWANVNRFGDYHDLHNHPHAYLSGTYYVAVPEQPSREALPGRGDRTPGAISFFDPRPQANMTAIRGDPQIEAEHLVQPSAGTLLMWPAFLHHLVHPNLAQTPRVSISFNVVLKNASRYLPDQD